MRIRTVLSVAIPCALLVLAATAGAEGNAENGNTLFQANCATCHGPGGKGDGPVGKALQPPPRDFTVGDFKFDADGDGTPGTDADLNEVIIKGAGSFGGSPLMAPWGHLPESDISDLLAFVRSLKQ